VSLLALTLFDVLLRLWRNASVPLLVATALLSEAAGMVLLVQASRELDGRANVLVIVLYLLFMTPGLILFGSIVNAAISIVISHTALFR
jgi:hypothetical protein